MMPVLLDWNGFILPAWHTMYLLGALSAFLFFEFLNKKWQLKLSTRTTRGIYLSSYFGGYFGARMASILIEQNHLFNSLEELIIAMLSIGPMTFYGGLIGAMASACLYIKIIKLRIRDVFDASILSGFLALSLGRIGCFLNGDDFGIPLDLAANESAPWWSVTFPNHPIQIPRVPIQIIESVSVGLLVAFLTFLGKRTQASKKGLVGIICINAYAVLRFMFEYLRGDERGWIIPQHMSTSQGLSLLIIILTLIGWLASKRLANSKEARQV